MMKYNFRQDLHDIQDFNSGEIKPYGLYPAFVIIFLKEASCRGGMNSGIQHIKLS